MSIIQDALKRQQEEGGVEENPLPGISASETPPPNDGKSRGRKTWLSLLIVLIILVAASVGAYIIYQVGLMPFMDKKGDAEEGVAATQDVAATPPEQQPGAQSQVGKLVSQVEETVAEAGQRTSERELDSEGGEQDGPESSTPAVDPELEGQSESDPNAYEENTPEVPPEPEQQEQIEEVAEEDIERPQPQQDPEPAPPTPKEPVIWPQINIKGIMAPGSGIRGAVLMDTSMFSEGDSYKGVRILKISKTSVLLEFEGEKRSLSTGQSVGN